MFSAAESYDKWLHNPLVHAVRSRAVCEMVSGLGGYCAIQLGTPRLDAQHWTIGQCWQAAPDEGEVRACYTALPFATEHMDIVVLNHVLEQVDDPHAILREAARVVMPHGHLLVVAMNPFSVMGAGLQCLRYASPSAWTGKPPRLYTVGRLSEWLTVLGFSLKKWICFSVKSEGAHLWDRCRYARLGYIILAKKQVAHPILWRRAIRTRSSILWAGNPASVWHQFPVTDRV